MELNDAFYKRKPHSGTIDIRVKAVEKTKHSFMMLWRNSDAVIFDKEHWLAILFAALTNLQPWFWLVSHEFDGVIHQVLKDYDHARSIYMNDGQFFLQAEYDQPSIESFRHEFHCILNDLPKRGVFQRIYQASNAREFEDIVEQVLHFSHGIGDASNIRFQAVKIPANGIRFEITEKPLDGNKRGFQIMGNRVGELGQLRISLFKFTDQFFALFLDLFFVPEAPVSNEDYS